MNPHFRRFKILVFPIMAGDMLKDDVYDVTSYFLQDFDDVLHGCGFVRQKAALCKTLELNNRN